MTTIKDIAREAGVSIATVSRVINRSRPVRKEAETRVKEALKNLDYQPNIAARNLVKRRNSHPSICVLFPEIITSFFSEVIKGLRDSVREKEYNLLIFDGSENYKEMVPTLALEGNPGVIVLCRTLPVEEKNLLERYGIRWILVDSYSPEDNCIYVDHLHGGRLAANYLLNYGCKNPVVITEKQPENSMQYDRIEGFQNKIKETLGKKAELVQVERSRSSEEFMRRGYQATKEVLQRDSADGIFYFCDELAYGGASALREAKNHLPLIGYDGFEATLYQGLATIKQPMREMGRAGGDRLAELLESDQQNSPQQLGFKPELVKPLR